MNIKVTSRALKESRTDSIISSGFGKYSSDIVLRVVS